MTYFSLNGIYTPAKETAVRMVISFQIHKFSIFVHVVFSLFFKFKFQHIQLFYIQISLSMQFNSSKYNKEDNISKEPRQQLQIFLNHFKDILTRSLDSYNKCAETYVKSMVGFLKEKPYYNETEMDLKHQIAKNIAIHNLQYGDDGLQTRLNEKIKTYIANQFDEFKARNEESRRIMTAVCVTGGTVSIRLGFVSSSIS